MQMTRVFEEESTVEQWDEDYYQPVALRLYDRAVPEMLRLMGVAPGATVLDADCGPGVHSIRVAKEGYRVCAIDLSNAMLNHARQRVAREQLAGQVDFRQMDLTKLDFPDGSFRYVFSWGVVIHIPEAEKALDELARVVEPGGKLALYLTNKTAIDHKLESLARFLVRKPLTGMQHLPLGDGRWYEMGGQKLWVWRFSARAVCAHLARYGFRLVRRRTGELSEIQLRLKGPARQTMLHLNNLAYRLNVPTYFAASQLLVFEKAVS
jgi:SAM-dependent methyltransferase